MDLLLCAIPEELGPFMELPPEGWRCAATGVGALQAAISTTRLILQEKPTRVVFAGTCGAYDARLPIGSLLAASEAIAISAEELKGRAYRPSAETSRWPATLELPFPAHPVAVPPAITKGETAARLLATVAAAEQLELTGVFAACHEARVPCGALLAVANEVGPKAHEQWLAHAPAAGQALAEALKACGLFGNR